MLEWETGDAGNQGGNAGNQVGGMRGMWGIEWECGE